MESDGYYAEQSADEIFSGPTHELEPSSYSSFHHHHHHRRSTVSSNRGDRFLVNVNRRSRRSSSLSRSCYADSEYGGRDETDAEDENDENIGNFHFFTPDEVVNAEGFSTVAGDQDSITESRAGSDDEEDLLLSPRERQHQIPHVYEFDNSSNELLSEMGVDMPEFEYDSTRLQQRYYISEEDMRILCAGYCYSRWKKLIYYFCCLTTLGIAYLYFRWFPRKRLYFTAVEAPLGKCDFVVVENQWGEVEIIEVDQQRYGYPLSTIFNLHTLAKVEAEGQDDGPTAASAREEGYIDDDPRVPFLRVFNYRYIRFLYNPVRDIFLTNNDWVSESWASEETAAGGLDSDTQARRELVFGRNCLDIQMQKVSKLLIDEVLHPFYIFQVFSIILWSFDEYYYYACAIFIISVFSVAEELVETRKSMARLINLANAHEDCDLRVLRSGFWTTIPSRELVPGDVFELSDPDLTTMPCDSVLLSGDAILNESILTGESVPVSKVAATDHVLHRLVEDGANNIPRSFLYCGTKIIRVRKPVNENDEFPVALALVVRTGFMTTKGALVRSMMFPRPSGFQFYRDSFRYIGVMGIVALMGFAISAYNFIRMGMTPYLIVVRALDLITIVVPPALPATLTIGTSISLARLRRKNIFCITPSRINVGGRLDVVCFDKTGTLTEEGLDVFGVHLVTQQSSENTKNCKFGKLLKEATEIGSSPLQDTLATCHELRNIDGEMLGDPLDVKMFEFSGWVLDENYSGGNRAFFRPEKDNELIVVKQFEFLPELRRMSVVANGSKHAGSSKTCILSKGAPEVMRDICTPESIPRNFDSLLHQYTHRGYRVIACAWRSLPEITDYSRDELEKDLIFAGLIVFENKLKPESEPVIKTLNRAGIRTIMCTGDNVLTAISVGRECRIVPPGDFVFAAYVEDSQLRWECVDNSSLLLNPHTLQPLQALPGSPGSDSYTLAVTGDVFSYIIQNGTLDQLERMLGRASIYARMSPDEKHELVAKLQEIEYTTGFCGDGANDCGALKAADVGISLSEAEASVAAPFTSRRFDVSCVLDVVAEGRCALTTSFSCFKYMSLYSAIQFVSVTILYSYGSNIGDFQFLWIDLFLIVPIAVFMAWSGPTPQIVRKRPSAELVSRKVLVPLLSYMVLFAVFQILAWTYGHMQPWYIAPVPGDNDNLRSTDNTSLFDMSCFQYIIAGWALCEEAPYRRPIWTNIPFLLTLAVTSLVTLVFVFINPQSAMGRLMDMTWTSTSFKLVILALTAVNTASLAVARRYVFRWMCDVIKGIRRRIGIVKHPRRYKEIMRPSPMSA